MKYVVKNADNSISVLEILKGNPEDYMREGMTLVGPVEDDTFPESGAFSESWRQISGGRVRVNMALARTQKMTLIRAERDERLKASDEDYVRLHSQDLDLTALKAKKQALRDLPEVAEAAIDEIDDADELHEYEPEWP